ncbi:MAG TPA: VTT domain-containing protein [Mycobacterium sp.]|nr:VTT domain-containing protein [Mycobacterium sp.]
MTGSLVNVASNPISPDTLLSGSAAAIVLAVVLFAECGILLGFFLPGDTLLLSAGIAVAAGTLSTSLTTLMVVAPIAAILGNFVGYAIGYRAGPVVFNRPDSRLFRREFVDRSHRFFERFGIWTILFARFVPVVRTVATVMAGVGRMRFPLYAVWTILGGIIWTDGILLLGDQLGSIAFVRQNKGYLDYVIIGVVVVSLAPVAIHYLRSRSRSRPRSGSRPRSESGPAR